jgi:hypothetical protein
MRAQLRDVLAAENSSVVAQEGNDRRRICPQRSQPHLAPIAVGQKNRGERCAEHGSDSAARAGALSIFQPRLARWRLYGFTSGAKAVQRQTEFMQA